MLVSAKIEESYGLKTFCLAVVLLLLCVVATLYIFRDDTEAKARAAANAHKIDERTLAALSEAPKYTGPILCTIVRELQPVKFEGSPVRVSQIVVQRDTDGALFRSIAFGSTATLQKGQKVRMWLVEYEGSHAAFGKSFVPMIVPVETTEDAR